jgi:hypothetical protein
MSFNICRGTLGSLDVHRDKECLVTLKLLKPEPKSAISSSKGSRRR